MDSFTFLFDIQRLPCFLFSFMVVFRHRHRIRDKTFIMPDNQTKVFLTAVILTKEVVEEDVYKCIKLNFLLEVLDCISVIFTQVM